MTEVPVSDLLSRLLAERRVLLADGATGTNYFDMGLASGEAAGSLAAGAARQGGGPAPALRRGGLRHRPHQQLRRERASG